MQIHGPNGSGKTSLLRILCGLSQPEQGEILWQQQDITKNSAVYHQNMAYLGHLPSIKLDLSPQENLRTAVALHPCLGDCDIDQALEGVGLKGYEDQPSRYLSAGQRRRVALARLLLSHARLWILDEPLTAIDKKGIADIEKLLCQHLSRQGMVILTSHHPVELDGVDVVDLHLDA